MRLRILYVLMAIVTIWMSSALAQVGPSGGGGSGGTSLPTTIGVTSAPDQAVSPSSVTGSGSFTFTNTGQTCSTSPCTITSATVICDATSGAVTLNLPAVTGNFRHILVKKIDATTNACTLTPNGTDTIDNASNLVLAGQFYVAQISDTGSGNWSVDDFYVANQNLLSNYVGPVSITGNQTNGGDQLSSVSVNGVPNVQAYGADPTNSTDSEPAFAAALAAACATQAYNGGLNLTEATIYVPPGTYSFAEPLWDACPSPATKSNTRITGSGEFTSRIVPTYSGDVIVAAPNDVISSNGPTLAASLMTGSGNALQMGSTSHGVVDLDEVLGINTTPRPYTGIFNGLAQFDIRFSFVVPNLSAGNQYIWTSDGKITDVFPGTSNPCSTAGNCRQGIWIAQTTGVLNAVLNVNGTLVALNSGGTTVTAGNCYEAEMAYDGTDVSLYLGGNGTSSCASSPGTVTRVAQSAATSTVVQTADEMNVLFGDLNHYFGANSDTSTNPSSSLIVDSIQISNTARHAHTVASYTQDTTKFSTDSNTLFLWNFDLTPQFVNNAPVAKVDTPSPAYLTWWETSGIGCCGGTHQVDNLAIWGNHNPGVMIAGDQSVITVSHVFLSLSTDGIITTKRGSYGSTVRDSDIYYSLRYGVALNGGLSTIDGLGQQFANPGGMVPVLLDGGKGTNILVAPGAETLCASVLGDFGTFDNVNTDAENGGTFWNTCLMENGETHPNYAIINSQIQNIGDPAILMTKAAATGVTTLTNNYYKTNSSVLVDTATASVPATQGGSVNITQPITQVASQVMSSSNPMPYCLQSTTGEACFTPWAGLPACNANNDHLVNTVTDAPTACYAGQIIASGGGTTPCSVYCDGANSVWRETGELGQTNNITVTGGTVTPYAATFVDGHITFANSTTCTASTGNLTCNVPSGTVDNDGLMMCIASYVSGQPWTAPAGWGTAVQSSFVGADYGITCFPRVSAGGEAGTPYTFTSFNGGADLSRANGAMMDYKGTNTSTLVEASGSASGRTVPSAAAPSITTSTADDLLITPLGICGHLDIPPPNQTTRINTPFVKTVGNHLTGLYSGDETVLLAGATGTRTATVSVGNCDDAQGGGVHANWGIANIALKPNASVGSTHLIDWSLANNQFRTLADNITYTFANVPSSTTQPRYLNVRTCEDSTGGRTVTFPNTVKWPGGTQPSMTTTANYCTMWQFEADNSNVYGTQVSDAIH